MRTLFTLTTLATLAFAQSAAALSCAPIDPFDTLADINMSTKSYTVVHGDLTITGAPNADGTIPMVFEGIELTDGDRTVELAITATQSCPSEACGAPKGAEDALVFVEVTPEGQFALDLTACGTYVFPAIADDEIDAMSSEIRGIMGEDEG